ncbi:MAG: hypothetical protein AAF600_10925 [Bacteroidota bacterium]
MATLEAQLTADISKLRSELNKAKTELKKYERAASVSNAKAANSFGRARKGIANTTPTLLEFNRVVQDAPFGIQGVANNIQQLTQNFGTLSKSAGGTIPALKLLAGSFAGPAGILFVVSAATSLLVTFGDEIFKSKNKAEELQKSLENLNDSFDSELRLSKAIEESLELQGKSTTGILNSRKQLLRTQIQNLSGLIKEQEELLNIQKLENARVDNLELLTGVFNKLFTNVKNLARFNFEFFSNAALKVAENLLDIEIDRSKFAAASKEDIEQQRQLQQKLTNLKAQETELANEILKINREITKDTRERLSLVQNNVQASGLTQVPNNLVLDAPVLVNSTQRTLSEAEIGIGNAFLDFRNNLDTLFSNAPVQGITNFTTTLGQALGQGASLVTAVGRGFVSSMGQFLSNFGDQLIQYGVAALAFSNVTKALTNPITAGPAAAAAIAAGAALKVASAAIQSTLQGGFGGSNVAGQGSNTGFTGSNTTSISNTSTGFGEVVFRIQGTTLVGVLNNTIRGNGRAGGNLSVINVG